MLLDAIQKDSLPAIVAAVEKRVKDIKLELADIARQQQEWEEAQKAAALASAAATPREPGEESEVDPPKSGRGKKGKEDKKKASKEEMDEERKQQEFKKQEEEARKARDDTNLRLEDEMAKLLVEVNAVRHITKVDLFDQDGAPCNLRRHGFMYADTLLRANGTYTLVKVEEGSDDQVTQGPIEVSI